MVVIKKLLHKLSEMMCRRVFIHGQVNILVNGYMVPLIVEYAKRRHFVKIKC